MRVTRRISKTDLIIVLIVFATAIAGVFFVGSYSGRPDEIVISVKNKVYKTASFDPEKKQVIKINDTNVVVINNGEIYMKSATCKDQRCVEHDSISMAGQSIICLPNEVVVEIKENIDVEDAAW